MAVPPPPTGEFEGFSFPPATFAAGLESSVTRIQITSCKSFGCCKCQLLAGQNAIVTRSSGEAKGLNFWAASCSFL